LLHATLETSETGKMTYDDGTDTEVGKNDGTGIDEIATAAHDDGLTGGATEGAWQFATCEIETTAKLDGNEKLDGRIDDETYPGIEIWVAGIIIVVQVDHVSERDEIK
jgi:hypothetical protein